MIATHGLTPPDVSAETSFVRGVDEAQTFPFNDSWMGAEANELTLGGST